MIACEPPFNVREPGSAQVTQHPSMADAIAEARNRHRDTVIERAGELLARVTPEGHVYWPAHP